MDPAMAVGPPGVQAGFAFKRNVYSLSAGFFCVFVAFNTAQALATSVSGKLASLSLATLYVTFALVSVVAPRLVNRLGTKLSLVLGSLPYAAMVLSMAFKPSYWIRIPLSFLTGAGAPLLWTGEGVLMSRLSLGHAKQHGLTDDTATSLFNSIFFSSFQLNGVVGTCVAGLVLTIDDSTAARNILFGVFGACAALGTLVFLLFVRDPQSKDARPSSGDSELSLNQPVLGDDAYVHTDAEDEGLDATSLLQTLRVAFTERRLALMIPIIVFNGMTLGFLFGDYTASLVAPGLGTKFTGWVVGVFYAFNSGFTASWGKLLQNGRTSRARLSVVAIAAHLVFFVSLVAASIPRNFDTDGDDDVKLRDPSSFLYAAAFVGAVVFGLGDSVWESQQPAILQTYFRSEPRKSDCAMANLKLWQSLGFAIQFSLGLLLSDLRIKAAILLGLLVVSSACLWLLHRDHPFDSSDEQQHLAAASALDSVMDDGRPQHLPPDLIMLGD